MYPDSDAGPNGGAVGTHAFQLEGEPAVAVSGILKEDIVGQIPGIGASYDRVNVLVAVVVEIAKGHAVAFLQVPEPTRGGNLLKQLASGIAKHAIGHDRAERGRPRTRVKVGPAVVVEVAEIAPHSVEHLVEPDLEGYIGERAVALVAVQAGVLGIVGQT